SRAPEPPSCALRGQADGVEDLRVPGAPAQVAGEGLADLVLARVRAAGEEVRRGHDQPGRAEAALDRARRHEGLLNRVQLAVRRQALDRHDLVSIRLRGEHETRADELPVEKHGARAALTQLAGVLRAGQAEPLAQGVQQAFARPHVGLAPLAVHDHVDPHPRHRSNALAASTPSAWRLYADVPRTSSIGLAASTTRPGNDAASPRGQRTSPGT